MKAEKNPCRLLASEILRLVPCDRIAIAIPLPDGSGFRICGTEPDGALFTDLHIPARGSCTAHVAAQRHGKLLAAIGEETHFAEEESLYRAGIRDAAFIPLFLAGELQGVAIVGRTEVNSLEPKSVRCLEKVSGLLAAVLASSLATAASHGPAAAVAFARRIPQEEEVERVCRGLLETILEQTGIRRAVLTLLDLEMNSYQWFFTGLSDAEIEEFHRHPPGEEEQRRIFQAERPPAGEGAASPLYVPLFGTRQRPLGYLTLEPGGGGAAALAADSLPAVETMAGMASLALERNQLVGEIKRERGRMQKIQEQLLHSERLSALGQLLSGLAHELNNPLAGVVGFAELALRNNTNPRCERDLQRIVSESQRCRKIVTNVLDFARRTKAERRVMDLNELVENVLDLRAYQLKLDNVKVQIDLDKVLPSTVGDYHQIQQVLLNIINNAHQAMQEVPGERTLTLRTRAAEEKIRIEIIDSGPGISPARLSRVFEPFFTTKAPGKGTGLGLSLSQGIVKQHGGQIRVESVPGKGTAFTVELPIREMEEEREAARPKESENSAEAPHTILVVDDEEVIVDLLHEVLAAVGHKVETARSGEQALDKILATAYDAVISDLKMPGLDGVRLYEQVCREKPEMAGRFVFSTGDLGSAATQDFFQKTGCPFLLKPFDMQAIQTTLSQIFSRT
ncbi:MAG TPA: ATP-binding protein [Candidatus Polarisedimenticolia bacterium]|jgi:signal transduction histidine kinase/ActR/RegA family two-component response regulator|nr:ATP-binding protein [Candidatus Polarisedimenticolia bacterium]